MIVSIEVEDEAWHHLPGLEDLARAAVAAALAGLNVTGDTETALLFTDDASIAAINAEWRGKPTPTNVLSFPAPEDMPVPDGEPKPLGDIVLAFGTVAREAEEQGKTLRDHAVHLIVHGVLHLAGHDHEDDAQAAEMERLEVEILKGLGISNPYYERQ
jgi:probable rRNA maturation factor